MSLFKHLPNLKQPTKAMKEMMDQQGFYETEVNSEQTYQTVLHDASTQKEYLLNIPIKILNGNSCVKLGESYMDKEETIPAAVKKAAQSKLTELADYMVQQAKEEENSASFIADEEQLENSMAPDMEGIKTLGKEMDSMKTNQELKEEGIRPDPVQFDKPKS